MFTRAEFLAAPAPVACPPGVLLVEISGAFHFSLRAVALEKPPVLTAVVSCRTGLTVDPCWLILAEQPAEKTPSSAPSPGKLIRAGAPVPEDPEDAALRAPLTLLSAGLRVEFITDPAKRQHQNYE